MVEKSYSKELQKGNGDIFCEIRRAPDNAFIYMNWVGLQSLETIVLGYNQALNMLREKPCTSIINNTREQIGPWEIAVSWLVNKWTPQAKVLGVKHFSHVLSHGIFGKRSFDKLQAELKFHFQVKAFEDEDLAEDWIRLKLDS